MTHPARTRPTCASRARQGAPSRGVAVIGVTGGIASGKSTVARFVAGRRGALLDCDALAHRVYDDPVVRRRIVAAFGCDVLTPSGKISRRRLAKIVFADGRALRRLEDIVRPGVRQIIEYAVAKARCRGAYIVLDAILLFQYTFTFDIDFAIVARAPRATRIRRIMSRDRISKAEAVAILDRQRGLEKDWGRADAVIDTGRPLAEVRRDAERARDRFLASRGEA